MQELKRSFSWQPVIVYFLLAVAISGPFFYWRSVLDWEGFRGPGILKTMSYMWGPGIAGLVCYALYKRRFSKEITVAGRSLWRSILIWVVPFLVLAVFGIRSEVRAADHLTPIYLIGLGFLTIWGEEFGWRWFLQDYLKPMQPLKKYILIGVLWELWHLRFLSKLEQPLMPAIVTSLVILVITIILSMIIGYVTDVTKSLAFASALHAWVDMLAEFSQPGTYVAAGVMVVMCALFVFQIRRKQAATVKEAI